MSMFVNSTNVNGAPSNNSLTQKDLIESNLQLIQKVGGKRAANLNSVEALKKGDVGGGGLGGPASVEKATTAFKSLE